MDPQDEVRVLPLKSRYPSGRGKSAGASLYQQEGSPGQLPADVGCLVMNIASISFLASYMRTGMPLTLKRVTIDGSAVKSPKKCDCACGRQNP